MIDDSVILRRVLEQARRQSDTLEELMDAVTELVYDGPRRIGLPLAGTMANMLFGYCNPGWLRLSPYIEDLEEAVEYVLSMMENDFTIPGGDVDD